MTDEFTEFKALSALEAKVKGGFGLDIEEFIRLESLGQRDDVIGRRAKTILKAYIAERTEPEGAA